MSNNNVLYHLAKKLDEQREVVKEDLIRGTSSLENYQKLCGVARGLDYAKQLIEDLAKQLEKEDE